jgi:hypothetical protein
MMALSAESRITAATRTRLLRFALSERADERGSHQRSLAGLDDTPIMLAERRMLTPTRFARADCSQEAVKSSADAATAARRDCLKSTVESMRPPRQEISNTWSSTGAKSQMILAHAPPELARQPPPRAAALTRSSYGDKAVISFVSRHV